MLHGGNCLRCLSTVGYDLQRGVAVDHETAIKSLADNEMRQILEEATRCTTEESFLALVNKYGEQIAQYGFPKVYICKLLNRDEMVESLLKQYFVYHAHAESSQFFKVLNRSGSVGDRIMENKALFDAIIGHTHPR